MESRRLGTAGFAMDGAWLRFFVTWMQLWRGAFNTVDIHQGSYSLYRPGRSERRLITNPPDRHHIDSSGFSIVWLGPEETYEPRYVNRQGEMIGVHTRIGQADELFIGTQSRTPLFVPGSPAYFYATGLSSQAEALFATAEYGGYKQWHRKAGILRELKDEIPTVPGWQMEAFDGLALNENGQILVRSTRENAGVIEYALWLLTPLHH